MHSCSGESSGDPMYPPSSRNPQPSDKERARRWLDVHRTKTGLNGRCPHGSNYGAPSASTPQIQSMNDVPPCSKRMNQLLVPEAISRVYNRRPDRSASPTPSKNAPINAAVDAAYERRAEAKPDEAERARKISAIPPTASRWRSSYLPNAARWSFKAFLRMDRIRSGVSIVLGRCASVPKGAVRITPR